MQEECKYEIITNSPPYMSPALVKEIDKLIREDASSYLLVIALIFLLTLLESWRLMFELKPTPVVLRFIAIRSDWMSDEVVSLTAFHGTYRRSKKSKSCSIRC